MHDNESIRELVEQIDAEGDDLTPWEIEFVAGLIDEDIHEFTTKQASIIERIFEERCE